MCSTPNFTFTGENSIGVRTVVEYEIHRDYLYRLTDYQPTTTPIKAGKDRFFAGDYQVIVIRPTTGEIRVLRKPEWKVTHKWRIDGLNSYQYTGDHLITYDGSELRIWDALKWAYFPLNGKGFIYKKPRSGKYGFIGIQDQNGKIGWHDLDGSLICQSLLDHMDCCDFFISFTVKTYIFHYNGHWTCIHNGEVTFLTVPSFHSVHVVTDSSFLVVSPELTKVFCYSAAGSLLGVAEGRTDEETAKIV